jgi:lipopolysaccharide transport system ATP-binding protein
LAEGTQIVNAVTVTLEPNTLQFYERDAVAFQVIDSLDGDSARGDWAGKMLGVVRPMLEWETEYSPNGRSAGAHEMDQSQVLSQTVNDGPASPGGVS